MKRLRWLFFMMLLIGYSFIIYESYKVQDSADLACQLGEAAMTILDGTSAIESTADKQQTAVNEPMQTKAEVLLGSMTLKEKIGQLFIVRLSALQDLTGVEDNNGAKGINDTLVNEGSVTVMDVNMEQSLRAYPVGGVALFSDNIIDPMQLTELTKKLQAQSKIPLFMAVDEEGGKVARIGNSDQFDVPRYESMQKVGESGDYEAAKEVGLTIGSYLKQYGFNLDFAPDADINTNPENIVIGDRSFGSDPKLVSGMVLAELAGLHEAGIMGCIKHFPGHGDTKDDTHTGYVSVTKTWEQLKSCELIPFMSALDDTDMIMAAHITTPNVTSDHLPTTLSNEMIQKKLRGELRYKGVVITDAMEMGAITESYSSSESAVKAVLAGVDIVLMPSDFKEAYEGVYTAVQEGEISEERIDESALRILTLKEKYGLIEE